MKLVILDRDGVINRDSETYVRSPDDWLPIPGSIEAISALCQAGYLVAVATNQSGIARGYFDDRLLAAMHRKMVGLVEAAGGRIAHIAYCPHGPDEDCACRKPKPGLIDQILDVLKVEKNAERWMVGDSLRDLQAGEARGFQAVLVRTGKGEETIAGCPDGLPRESLIADDLAAAAALIIGANADRGAVGRSR